MTKRTKHGGRRKGTPNKITGTVKEMIKISLTKELKSLPKLLSELSPKERVDALIKFLPYLIPKMDAEMERSQNPVKDHDYYTKLLDQFNFKFRKDLPPQIKSQN